MTTQDHPYPRVEFLIDMFADWNFAAADAELAGVREKDPTVVNAKALLRLFQGRLEEALVLFEEAVKLDPLHAAYHPNLGNILLRLGRLDEADAAYRRALELQPATRSAHLSLSIIAIRKGDLDAALREAELEPAGLSHLHAIALARSAGGEREQADAALQKLIEQAAERSPSRVAMSSAYERPGVPIASRNVGRRFVMSYSMPALTKRASPSASALRLS